MARSKSWSHGMNYKDSEEYDVGEFTLTRGEAIELAYTILAHFNPTIGNLSNKPAGLLENELHNTSTIEHDDKYGHELDEIGSVDFNGWGS
jgi:hypothetical protein